MTQSMQFARSQWLDVITDALDGFGSSFPWNPVCRQLGRQLDAPVTGKFHWDAHGRGTVMAYPFPDWFDLRDVAGRAPPVHPLARYYSTHATAAPLSTTQVPFAGGDDVRTYEAELRACQIEHHVWIPIERGAAGSWWSGCAVPPSRSTRRHWRSRRSRRESSWRCTVTGWCSTTGWRGIRSRRVPTRWPMKRDSPRAEAVVLSLVAQGLTSRAIGFRCTSRRERSSAICRTSMPGSVFRIACRRFASQPWPELLRRRPSTSVPLEHHAPRPLACCRSA